METCARAIIAKHYPTVPIGPAEQTIAVWRVKCRQCRFEAENFRTANAAEAVAHAHCSVHCHELVIRQLTDSLYGTVGPEEGRR